MNQQKWYSIKHSNKDLVNERVQQIRQQNISSKIPAYPKRTNNNNKTIKYEVVVFFGFILTLNNTSR